MSQQNNQLAQYKDALKLMKKKCQATETQNNEIKAELTSTQELIISFLEHISTPFSETNVKPELTLNSLTCWWSQQSKGMRSAVEPVVESLTEGTDISPDSLIQQVQTLKLKLKETENEKNNLECTLSRRQDEYMALNESILSSKEEMEKKNSEYEELVNRNRQLVSQLNSIRDSVVVSLNGLHDLISVSESEEEEKKKSIIENFTHIFVSEDSADISINDTVITPLVNSFLVIKSSTRDMQLSVDSHQQLITAQTDHITQLEAEAVADKDQIDKLQRRMTALEAAAGGDEELEEQLDDMEAANESLRTALLGAKKNMEQQMARQQESERQLLHLQEELVASQQTGNDMVQQAYQAAEDKTFALTAQLTKAEETLSRKEEELDELRTSWETSVGQYEQELAVLRARKVAVEQQVTVSEKFLDDHNRIHREELAKLQSSLQAAQEETQELRCQVLEREAELESSQQTGEETTEQLHGQVMSLTEQLRAMQNKLSSQASNVVSVKRREAELEGQMKERLTASIQKMEEKDREIIRQQQHSYEEEMTRIRQQVLVLSHELEEERKNGRKMRETVTQLNELFESQDRQIEILRSDVAMRDSELMAGKEQVRKLSILLSSKMSTQI